MKKKWSKQLTELITKYVHTCKIGKEKSVKYNKILKILLLFPGKKRTIQLNRHYICAWCSVLGN